MMHMTVGGNDAPDHCNHWYLKFNGDKCTNPETIEMLDYSATTGDMNMAMGSMHRFSQVHRSYRTIIISIQCNIIFC